MYQGLETGYSSAPNPEGVNGRWKYDQGDPNVPVVARNTDGPPGGTPPWLQTRDGLDPKLRAFVATGTLRLAEQLPGQLVPAEPELLGGRGARITFRCYEGGHMMYEDHDARLALRRTSGASTSQPASYSKTAEGGELKSADGRGQTARWQLRAAPVSTR